MPQQQPAHDSSVSIEDKSLLAQALQFETEERKQQLLELGRNREDTDLGGRGEQEKQLKELLKRNLQHNRYNGLKAQFASDKDKRLLDIPAEQLLQIAAGNTNYDKKQGSQKSPQKRDLFAYYVLSGSCLATIDQEIRALLQLAKLYPDHSGHYIKLAGIYLSEANSNQVLPQETAAILRDELRQVLTTDPKEIKETAYHTLLAAEESKLETDELFSYKLHYARVLLGNAPEQVEEAKADSALIKSFSEQIWQSEETLETHEKKHILEFLDELLSKNDAPLKELLHACQHLLDSAGRDLTDINNKIIDTVRSKITEAEQPQQVLDVVKQFEFLKNIYQQYVVTQAQEFLTTLTTTEQPTETVCQQLEKHANTLKSLPESETRANVTAAQATWDKLHALKVSIGNLEGLEYKADDKNLAELKEQITELQNELVKYSEAQQGTTAYQELKQTLDEHDEALTEATAKAEQQYAEKVLLAANQDIVANVLDKHNQQKGFFSRTGLPEKDSSQISLSNLVTYARKGRNRQEGDGFFARFKRFSGDRTHQAFKNAYGVDVRKCESVETACEALRAKLKVN